LIKWFDPIYNKNNNKIDTSPSTTTTAIDYNISTYDNNNEANIAHSIHRTDKILKWFNNNNNNNNIPKSLSNNNNNNNNNNKFDTPSSMHMTITTTINGIPVIRDLEVRATVFFTSKIHALNT
jgi:hypothetical protein